MISALLFNALWLFLSLVFGALCVSGSGTVALPFYLLLVILPLGAFLAMRYFTPGWMLAGYVVVGSAYFAVYALPTFVNLRHSSAVWVFGGFVLLALVMVELCEGAAWLGRQCFGEEE